MAKHHQLEKRQRHDRQVQKLAGVLEIEGPEQAAFLFRLWPDRLPKLVRKAISSDILTRWRGLRSQRTQRRAEAMLRHELEKLVSRAVRAESKEFERTLIEEHHEAADAVVALISGLSGAKVLTVAFAAGEDGEDERVGSFEMAPGEGVPEPARVGLCAALEFGGGALICQTLPMRVEAIDDSGERQWVPQQRLFGIALGGGAWEPMNEAQARQAYVFETSSGQGLARDEHIVFGDLRATLQRQGKR